MNAVLVSIEKTAEERKKGVALLESAITEPMLVDWVEGIVMQLRTSIPSWTDKEINHVSVSIEGPTVIITLGNYYSVVDYEDLLKLKGVSSSHSGTSLQYNFESTLLFRQVKLKADFRCDIPKEDIEFLKQMNKIVEDTTTSLHSLC